MNDKIKRALSSLRFAILCVVLALILEGIVMVHFTPATFMVFVMVGVPLCMVSVGVYVAYVLRRLMRGQVL